MKAVRDRLQTMSQPLVRHEEFLSFREDENDHSKVTFPEFTSTTASTAALGAATEAGKYNLRFNEGIKGAPVQDVSAFPQENEVILPPQKKCKVVKRVQNAQGGEYIELEDDDE